MIEDIYNVGLCVQNFIDTHQLDEELLPDMPDNLTGIVGIKVNSTGEYEGLQFIESSKDNILKMLLKKKSSKGANYSPTALITNIETVLDNKIISWFKKYTKKTGSLNQEEKIISSIYYSLTKKSPKIIADYKSLNLASGSYALTVIFNNKLPIDTPFIFDRYASELRGKREPVGKGTCSLCMKPDSELIAKSSVFKFFSDDKPGNIAGGFSKDRVWMNYPICSDCETILSKGKSYIWKYLVFPYYGLSFYLIPSSRSLSSVEEITGMLKDINQKRFSFSQRYQNAIYFAENEIWEILGDYNDINSFHLLFIKSERSGQVERILLELKDVFPSRIKRLFEAKKNIDNRFSIEEPGFNYSFLRRFFLKQDQKNRNNDSHQFFRSNDLDQLFLDITKSLFLQEVIDPKILLPHFMKEIRYALVNDGFYSFRETARSALICFEYLYAVNCIKYDKSEGRVSMEHPLETIFEKYANGLDTDLKRALFLLGALVSKVMVVQYANLGSTPFQNRLRSLKMRQEHVEGLMNEAIIKLREYDSYSKSSRKIVNYITELILQSPANWPLSVDQINFYISAGMALHEEVYSQFENTISEKEEEL